MSSKVEEIYEAMKELTPSEIDWLIRNITYNTVAYWNENDKGIIYDGSHSQINIEQATRLQQHLSGLSDLLEQSLGGRVFGDENDNYTYFEDLLTDNFYSKFKDERALTEEYKEKAWKYDELCE